MNAVVIERQGSPGDPFWTLHWFWVPMERGGVRGEYHGSVRHRADLLDALLHVSARRGTISSVAGFPPLVQVEDEIGTTLPIPVVRVHREVCVDIQKAAASRLVQPSAFERRVFDQVIFPKQAADVPNKARGVSDPGESASVWDPRSQDQYC